MFEGGLIHQIPDNKLDLSRTKQSIPPQAKELVEYLCLDNDIYQTKNYYNIYGSFNYRLQNYPSDIDSTNIVEYKLDDEVVAKLVKTNIQKLVKKLATNKLGRRYADLKCGTYPNGESIHWTPQEVLKGYRVKNKKDINGQSHTENITLFDAIQHKKALMKLDMVAPYMGRYVEVSCMFQLKTNSGWLTRSHAATLPEVFLKDLATDTGKQLKKNKIFKVIKRMYSNAKIRKDIRVLRILEPLINSNLSRLASIKADISTLLLLLSTGNHPSSVVLKGEISKIKFSLDNVLDIDLNLEKLYNALDNVYILLVNKDIKAVDLLEKIEKYLDNKINSETILYLKSVGINNFNYFGRKYIIN